MTPATEDELDATGEGWEEGSSARRALARS